MVKLMAVAAVLVLIWMQGAMAQAEAQAVETPLDRAMQQNPDRFETAILDLIAGFGGSAGLTVDGIRDHVALKRASARASAMRRLIAMDLDGDGAVLRDEMQVAQRAASAASRGRVERQFALADADADGRIDGDEMAADGLAAALRALGADEAALLMSVLTLDADGDGALSAGELRSTLTRLDDAT